MTGLICLWSGAIVDIPAGWVLCDGNFGTPDLTDRFVVGAGDSYAVDDIGGSDQHNHDFTGDGHSHGIPVALSATPPPVVMTLSVPGTNIAAATGTTDNATELPPYYALAYIMKT